MKTRNLYITLCAACAFSVLIFTQSQAAPPAPPRMFLISISFSENPNDLDSMLGQQYRHSAVPISQLNGRRLYAHLDCLGAECPTEPIDIDCSLMTWTYHPNPSRPVPEEIWTTGCSVVYPPPFPVSVETGRITVRYPLPTFGTTVFGSFAPRTERIRGGRVINPDGSEREL